MDESGGHKGPGRTLPGQLSPGAGRLLGEGGAAQVYLGEHRMLTMQAAIKVLYPRFSLSERDITRFLGEV